MILLNRVLNPIKGYIMCPKAYLIVEQPPSAAGGQSKTVPKAGPAVSVAAASSAPAAPSVPRKQVSIHLDVQLASAR